MITIIPARGGSKGLPGKNIKLLNGKPLIAYTIEAAVASKYITRVIVSTDSKEIAEIAISFGAEVPFMRPEFLATDEAMSIDVYKFIINKLENDEKIQIDEVVILQPTSPLRTAKHIDEAIKLFLQKKADSVISYCKEEHPIFWNKYINEEGRFEDIFEGNFLKNRQEIRSTFYPNGAIYIFKKAILFQNQYYTNKSYAYVMRRIDSIDIDTQEDFTYAEYINRNN